MNEHRRAFEYPDTYYNTRSAMAVLPLLIRLYRPESILDAGCGNGSWLKAAMDLGVPDILGIEYPLPDSSVQKIPATRMKEMDLGKAFDLQRRFDLALCLEVGEHLGMQQAACLVENLVAHADIVVFSAAIPGQGGEGHINEQAPAYWQKLFNDRGYETFDDLRPLIWDNEEVFWWYRQNMFMACRRGIKKDCSPENIPHLVHPELFKEMAGFRVFYEYKCHEFKEAYEKSERTWNNLDRSTRYHLRRLKEKAWGVFQRKKQ